MEVITRILEQHPLQTREYTDRNGQKQQFTAMGFVLASGADTLFAEMTGEQAVKQGKLDTSYYYKADLSMRSDNYTTERGEQRHGTRIYLNRIAVL
jgi:hypothetical protein